MIKRRFVFHKIFHLLHPFRTMSSNPKEIKIPNSYGFISAKEWGKEDAEPVLALHGWQDNSGTYDKLIPYLHSRLHIVAIDAPGHGLSSHKPIGAFYHYLEMLMDIKKVVDYMKWSSFSIIGHSMGGTLAILYACIFPESVKSVVCLDVAKPASRTAEQLPDCVRNGLGGLLEIERKMSNPTPVYSLEEAKDRLIRATYNQLSPESAEILLKRGCKPSPCGKGVVFTRDIRIQMTEDLHKFSHEDLKMFIRKMQCDLLLIKGKSSHIFASRTPDVVNDFLKLYKEVCRSFQVVEVEGGHFVHLNHPERVAPHIDNFFRFCLARNSKM